MFDIGFSELLVIAVVALIVIGPERLPRVARTMGHLFGRLQRYVSDVKADINRELELDELKKLQSSVQEAARSLENTIHSEVNQAESQIRNTVEADAAAVEPPPVVEANPSAESRKPESGPGETPSEQRKQA